MTGTRIGTFPKLSEYQEAKAGLEELAAPFRVVSPEPGFRRVGVPSLVLDEETYRALCGRLASTFVFSGWVEYRPASIAVPQDEPASYSEDLFGEAAVMVLAPCVADTTKIRLIAHLAGDLTEVFPYMNADMREASYNRNGPTFTFMDGYRMISLYPRRIAVAKADEIVDAWRTLEAIRCCVNETWARRAEITPSYEMREKPPALEIFKRLPRTNCRACGEQTCLAFAVKLWTGSGRPSQCKPVFGGDYGHLRPALVEICRGLGVIEGLDSGQDMSIENQGVRK